MPDIYDLFCAYVHEFETYLVSSCLTLYIFHEFYVHVTVHRDKFPYNKTN
jgi:hypothetical protein